MTIIEELQQKLDDCANKHLAIATKYSDLVTEYLDQKEELKLLRQQLAIAKEALEKCDPSIHPVFVCNKIRKEALERIGEAGE